MDGEEFLVDVTGWGSAWWWLMVGSANWDTSPSSQCSPVHHCNPRITRLQPLFVGWNELGDDKPWSKPSRKTQWLITIYRNKPLVISALIPIKEVRRSIPTSHEWSLTMSGIGTALESPNCTCGFSTCLSTWHGGRTIWYIWMMVDP